MLTMQSQPMESPSIATNSQHPLRRGRAAIITAVTLLALLSATVAIGQSSQDFDLACRGIIASGGTVSSGGNFAVIDAFGIPFAPPQNSDTSPTYGIRSADFAVRGGFLPGYPRGQSVTAATAGTAPTIGSQTNVQRLPFIPNLRAIIRGGC